MQFTLDNLAEVVEIQIIQIIVEGVLTNQFLSEWTL